MPQVKRRIYKWPPAACSKTTRNASHSNSTVFLGTFKATFSIYNLPKNVNYWFLFYSEQTIMLDIGQHRLFSNSKDLLDTLSSRSQYVYNIFKTCDFSTLYTTIPHMLLKSRIKELIQRCFLQGLLKYKDRKLAGTFNSSFRYIDDVLSLNNTIVSIPSKKKKIVCQITWFWWNVRHWTSGVIVQNENSNR